MDGVLLLDKPKGPTSFDVVRWVRRAANERSVGHAGTLDPLASGLLVVGLGRGTKIISLLMDGHKRYVAEIAFGVETDTDDSTGQPVATADVPLLDRKELEDTLRSFIGEIEQAPPRYCALKRGGESFYRIARRGEQVMPEPRLVRIDSIDIVELDQGRLVLDVFCQKGTYIRALARDLGRALGSRAHLSALRRLESSGFSVDEAILAEQMKGSDAKQLLSARLLDLSHALGKVKRILLDGEQSRRIRHGQNAVLLEVAPPEDGVLVPRLVFIDPLGQLCAIAERREGVYKLSRVFPAE